MLKQYPDSYKVSNNNSRLVEVLVLLLILHLIFTNTGCKKKGVTTDNREKVFNVKTQVAEKKTFRPFIETIGTLSPNEEVIVSAEVKGILKDVMVDEGTSVSEGMILAGIDETDYALDVKRAQTALRQAEATLANTRLEYERKQNLYKEELVTKQQFDDISTRLSLVRADLESAETALLLSRQQLSKTKIYSLLSGMVKEKNVSRGDYVKDGSPLFNIIQTNPIKLIFAVPEMDVKRLKKGQDVLLKVDAFPGREFKGRLNIIYPSLDEKTRTLQGEALVPNPDRLLKPGLFAKIKLFTGKAVDIIVIPITAIIYEAERVKVFVLEGDVVKERMVKLGSKYGEVMEILENLKEGEEVVVVGQQNLAEGVKVNVAR